MEFRNHKAESKYTNQSTADTHKADNKTQGNQEKPLYYNEEREVRMGVIAALDIVRESGKPAQNWYAGITNNPKRRLGKGEHAVDTSPGQNKKWACWQTSSDRIARAIENKLIYTKYFEGHGRGRNDAAIFLYIYLMSDETNESEDGASDRQQVLESAVPECDWCNSVKLIHT